MAKIQQYLDNIKNALFGREVRGSIHDGIEAINKEVERTTAKQEHLDGTFNQLIINSGTSNAEIVDARVEANGTQHPTLGARLDHMDNKFKEVNSQLEHIQNEELLNKTDKTTTANIQQQINDLVLSSGGDSNLEVVQSRNGFDTLNDRLNDSSFVIDVIQNTTNDYVNLFYLYDNGFYVESTTGELKSNVSVSTTKFIDIAHIDKFIYTYVGKNATHQMAFYDADKQYISGRKTNIIGEWVIDIPTNAKYCKISFYNENIDTFYIKGKTKIKNYIDSNINEINVNINGGSTSNLLNPLNSINGGFYGAGYSNDTLGVWKESSFVSQSEFIDINGCSNIKIIIPANATSISHQWVFKNSEGVIFNGGWRAASASSEDVEVDINIPQGAVSFSSAYLTNSPIQILFIKNGLNDRIKSLENGLTAKLKGKKLGIIGDSISTYNGYVPSGYAHFYPRGEVTSVNSTWWKKLIDNTGMELCSNCSWSGSTVSGDTSSTTNAYSGASEKRVNDLTNLNGDTPDIIIVYISINDFGKDNNIVTGSSTGNESINQDGTLNDISRAYVLLIKKLMTKYPNAKIYCTTIMAEQFASEMHESYVNGYPNINPNDNVTLPTWNNMIRSIADNMGCGLIDMAKCGINYFNLDEYTIDKLHPNIAGHELMYKQALKDII